MLSTRCRIEDLDLAQWKRLSGLALAHARLRRLFVVHDAGRVLRCHDSVAGDQPLPYERITDAAAQAQALLDQAAPRGVEQVWILDPEAFHLALGQAQAALDPAVQGMDDYLAQEWQVRSRPETCAVAPASDFLFHGLPWQRLSRFVAKMAPPSCTFVLGVFDGDALWASLFAQLQDGQIVGLSTSAALDPEDVKDVVGRDQHPFLLATVANRYRRPAFGWFCQRPDFEAYMLARTVEAKDEVFQKALMQGRATFDFNILVDKGITPLGPMNPGEAAIAGVDRESNPRTQTPDPEKPGPSAF